MQNSKMSIDRSSLVILRDLDDASNRIVAELQASPEDEIPAGIRQEALELVQAIRSEAHQPKRNKSVLLALRDRLNSVARPIASLAARLAPLWPILEKLLGL